MYYPRSFLKFILLGFLLVSLPLLYALAELILSLDRLASQSREEVIQSASAARTSRLLFEQTATLERIVRQYLILEDHALVDDYNRLRQDFRTTTRQLSQLPLERDHLAALERLGESETALHARLIAPQKGVDAAADLAEGYARLGDGAQAMLTASNALTQAAIERLQETAAQGREKWLWLALATVGIAIALAIGFAVLIARPIRQLDQAIRQMGGADFSQAVHVNGPQDLRYLGQRLEWLRVRLSELEQQQNRFLRHVSHELKTPLTAVREGAELLRDEVGGKLSREQRDIVRIVRENTLSLQKLIEDLLKYHQTRAFEPATLGPVVLADVVRRVLRENKLAALARGITIQTDLKAPVVIGDADRLRTIVDNLVSNAIKYASRAGAIDVRVWQEAGEARLEVCDNGPGVAVDERERIFESFYQGKAPPGGRVKGSGLGLAIAREYALAHGGRIEIRDRPDGARGACFRLTLPLARRRISIGGSRRRRRRCRSEAESDGAQPLRGRPDSDARRLRCRAARADRPGPGRCAILGACSSTGFAGADPDDRVAADRAGPPPPARPVREPEPAPSPASRSAQVAVIPPAESLVPPAPQVIIAEPTAEEREFGALLADLQRYNGLSADELRRESQAMTQAIARGRSDANRVRLAVLYTLTRQSAQDDQRALQLFETIAKSNPASASIKQLAAVLSVQVAERVRAVRDEQARSEAAIQKLEALRAMERSLLRDRVRSGGGGGGAGSGGGGN